VSEQAEREINEILDGMVEVGLPPRAMIALVDVQKAMVLAWDRGYNAAVDDAVAIVEGRMSKHEARK
jgi:hypothetical protein